MYNYLLKFAVKLLVYSGILFGIHYYIFATFFQDLELYFPLWTIYLFNFVLVLGVFGIIAYLVNKGSQKGYQLFLILTVVKMVLAIVFLLPVIGGKSANSVIDVSNFFIPYFLFLGFEIFSLNNFFKNQ